MVKQTAPAVRTVKARAKQQAAVRLHDSGMTFGQIAIALSYSDPSSAYAAYIRGVAAQFREKAAA